MADDRKAFTIQKTLAVSPMTIFEAWTEAFDTWFASPGAIRMNPIEGEPFWFEVIHDGEHHPHYGRFLSLEPGHLIEETWVTGVKGTRGAETVLRIELVESPSGTDLRLTHSGFLDDESAQRHADSWPQILTHLESCRTPN